jgi:hypothetical protein
MIDDRSMIDDEIKRSRDYCYQSCQSSANLHISEGICDSLLLCTVSRTSTEQEWINHQTMKRKRSMEAKGSLQLTVFLKQWWRLRRHFIYPSLTRRCCFWFFFCQVWWSYFILGSYSYGVSILSQSEPTIRTVILKDVYSTSSSFSEGVVTWETTSRAQRNAERKLLKKKYGIIPGSERTGCPFLAVKEYQAFKSWRLEPESFNFQSQPLHRKDWILRLWGQFRLG